MSIQNAALRAELPVALKRVGLTVVASTVVAVAIHLLWPGTDTATAVGLSLGLSMFAGALWEDYVRGIRLAVGSALAQGIVAGGSVFVVLTWATR